MSAKLWHTPLVIEDSDGIAVYHYKSPHLEMVQKPARRKRGVVGWVPVRVQNAEIPYPYRRKRQRWHLDLSEAPQLALISPPPPEECSGPRFKGSFGD